jgi:hypothetical protein
VLLAKAGYRDEKGSFGVVLVPQDQIRYFGDGAGFIGCAIHIIYWDRDRQGSRRQAVRLDVDIYLLLFGYYLTLSCSQYILSLSHYYWNPLAVASLAALLSLHRLSTLLIESHLLLVCR